jgi:serine kinase of HPr protein (carbohydrate metabolism regulator)
VPPANLHASALVIGDRGLVVTGPSGSGKTALCLALLDRCRASGHFARLISDDQIYLRRAGERLIAEAPEAIAGLVEIRGFRPSPVASERCAVVDRMVRLVPAEEAPRFSEGETETLQGCAIPCLRLPALDTPRNVSAVSAWLALPPFGTI